MLSGCSGFFFEKIITVLLRSRFFRNNTICDSKSDVFPIITLYKSMLKHGANKDSFTWEKMLSHRVRSQLIIKLLSYVRIPSLPPNPVRLSSVLYFNVI